MSMLGCRIRLRRRGIDLGARELRGETITIGSRPDCTLRLEGPGVAPLHVQLRIVGERLLAEAHDRCPITICGLPLSASVLRPSDTIELADHQLLLEEVGPLSGALPSAVVATPASATTGSALPYPSAEATQEFTPSQLYRITELARQSGELLLEPDDGSTAPELVAQGTLLAPTPAVELPWLNVPAPDPTDQPITPQFFEDPDARAATMRVPLQVIRSLLAEEFPDRPGLATPAVPAAEHLSWEKLPEPRDPMGSAVQPGGPSPFDQPTRDLPFPPAWPTRGPGESQVPVHHSPDGFSKNLEQLSGTADPALVGVRLLEPDEAGGLPTTEIVLDDVLEAIELVGSAAQEGRAAGGLLRSSQPLRAELAAPANSAEEPPEPPTRQLRLDRLTGGPPPGSATADTLMWSRTAAPEPLPAPPWSAEQLAPALGPLRVGPELSPVPIPEESPSSPVGTGQPGPLSGVEPRRPPVSHLLADDVPLQPPLVAPWPTTAAAPGWPDPAPPAGDEAQPTGGYATTGPAPRPPAPPPGAEWSDELGEGGPTVRLLPDRETTGLTPAGEPEGGHASPTGQAPEPTPEGTEPTGESLWTRRPQPIPHVLLPSVPPPLRGLFTFCVAFSTLVHLPLFVVPPLLPEEEAVAVRELDEHYRRIRPFLPPPSMQSVLPDPVLPEEQPPEVEPIVKPRPGSGKEAGAGKTGKLPEAGAEKKPTSDLLKIMRGWEEDRELPSILDPHRLRPPSQPTEGSTPAPLSGPDLLALPLSGPIGSKQPHIGTTADRGQVRDKGRDVFRRTVKVSGTSLAFTGKRTRKEVAAVLERAKSSLRFCYERELENNPTAQGQVKLHLMINADGQVTSAGVFSEDITSDSFSSCMKGQLLALTFRKTRDEQSELNWQLLFSPGGR